MRIRLLSAAFTLSLLMLAVSGVQAQGAWGYCGYQNVMLDRLDELNRPALRSAVVIVLGDTAATNATCDQRKVWVDAIIFGPGNMQAEWNEGLKFSDAVKALKMYLAQPNIGGVRVATIDNAFLEVYGRPTTTVEMLEWEPQVKAQTAWYATIASAEIKKLNSNIGTRRNTTGRRPMVDQAYKTSMGRIANDGESSYWLPRTEHYRLIVAASRSWLYSDGGTKDLISTIKLALATKNGAAPSEADVKAAIIKFKGNAAKPIYAEMIK